MADVTKSIGSDNLAILKESLKYLVQKFIIAPQVTHVSLESFAVGGTLHNRFNDPAYHSEQAVLDLIDGSLAGLSSPTRLDRALFTANQEMFIRESGHRPGVQSVMVLITDGKSHPDTDDFSSAVNSLKVNGLQSLLVTRCDTMNLRDPFKPEISRVGHYSTELFRGLK